MASALEFDLTRFDKAMTELSRHSNRTASEIVTLNGRAILKSIVHNSPRLTGTMNGGWLTGWNALNVPGYPNNKPRGKYGAGVLAKKGRKYFQGGSIENNLRKPFNPSITFRNSAYYTERGKRVNYPHIVAAKTGFMRKAEDEVERKLDEMLEQRYQRLLRSRR